MRFIVPEFQVCFFSALAAASKSLNILKSVPCRGPTSFLQYQGWGVGGNQEQNKIEEPLR